jgi:hypothetical protein
MIIALGLVSARKTTTLIGQSAGPSNAKSYVASEYNNCARSALPQIA